MKLLRIRGVHRIVGNCHADPARSLALHSGPYLHELVRDAQTGAPPAPPGTLDYLEKALPGLRPLLANGPDDTAPDGAKQGVGDCVCAADLHLCSLRSLNAGGSYVPTAAEAVDLYSCVAGYRIGVDATDQGTDPSDLIAYRLAGHPYPDGSKLLAAVPVDATSRTALMQATWLGVGLLCWADMPDAWESAEDEGDTWDVAGASNPNNGHGVAGLCYPDGPGLYLDTWGEVDPPIILTWAAAAKYLVPSAGGGCVAMLDADCLDSITGKCPAGYDLTTLRQYLGAVQAAASASPGSPSSEVDRIRAALVDFARTLGHEEERIVRWLGHFFQSTEGSR